MPGIRSMTAGKFYIGQIVAHRLFGYLGVVYDVDPGFTQSEEWYQHMALSRPPKDQPWYHVLVDGMEHVTYVAEQNLGAVVDPQPIRHPLLENYFFAFNGKSYEGLGPIN